jgi:hypothetical protein
MAADASSSRFSGAPRFVLLFLLGAVLGAALFMSWRPVWDSALKGAAGKAQSARVEWREIAEAGPLHAKLLDVRVTTPRGTFTLPEADIRIGLFPLVRLAVRTGPVLNVSLGMTRHVSFEGGIELSALVDDGSAKGVVNATGELGLASLSGPPQSGTISLKAPSLTVSGVAVRQASMDGTLDGSKLTVTGFSVAGPVPLEAKGTADLNWKDLPASRVQATGTITVGQTRQPFTKSGPLKAVLGL